MHALEILTNHRYGIADKKKNVKKIKQKSRKTQLFLKLGTVAWAKLQNLFL